jgi:hypothetical protein
MKWFKINGKEFDVRIFEPEESFTILFSSNTGRTLDEGAPMTLDPLGTFFNYSLTIGNKRGKESDFEQLWELVSTPRYDALLITFPRGRKKIWSTKNENGEEVEGFYAYVSTGKRGIKKITEEINGDLKDIEYDTFTANFIAAKAQVIPE